MSYEAKARTAAANLKASHLRPCGDCKGFEEHEPNCPSLRPALLEKAPTPGAATLDEPLTLEQVKAVHVARVLREKGWNKTTAARALAIDRRTLYQMIDRYGIKEPPR
jgi:transcriptional regulator of acetoin/glycerol metabolism